MHVPCILEMNSNSLFFRQIFIITRLIPTTYSQKLARQNIPNSQQQTCNSLRKANKSATP